MKIETINLNKYNIINANNYDLSFDNYINYIKNL